VKSAPPAASTPARPKRKRSALGKSRWPAAKLLMPLHNPG
jgi:hypothetical protein